MENGAQDDNETKAKAGAKSPWKEAGHLLKMQLLGGYIVAKGSVKRGRDGTLISSWSLSRERLANSWKRRLEIRTLHCAACGVRSSAVKCGVRCAVWDLGNVSGDAFQEHIHMM